MQTILLTKAMTLDRANKKEVTTYNKVLETYQKTLFSFESTLGIKEEKQVTEKEVLAVFDRIETTKATIGAETDLTGAEESVEFSMRDMLDTMRIK